MSSAALTIICLMRVKIVGVGGRYLLRVSLPVMSISFCQISSTPEPAAPAAAGPVRLKYSGVHAQEDRDARAAAKAVGAEKRFWHMIRIRIPLGVLRAEQYLALDQLSERVAYNHSLRATAGQSLQLHGVAAENLAEVLSRIREVGLTSACSPDGLEFAIAAPPAPIHGPAYEQLRGLGNEICTTLYGAPDGAEFPAHKPRKFTIGLALPDDNSANVYAHDVGLVLVRDGEARARVNVLVGGGLSMPGRRPGSYARIGTPLGSTTLDHALATVRGIIEVFKEHGQIATRRFTRLKYVVDELGTEAFRRRLEERLGFDLEPWIPLGEFEARDWLGWHEQGDGRLFCGIKVPSGRIMDVGAARYKTGLRAIVEAFRPLVIVTPAQDLILANLTPAMVQPLERIVEAYHIPFGGKLTPVRSLAMACAGLPTCSLAVAESERVAEELLRELEGELARVGKCHLPFAFRISGCSIGCIRPNMVDLGAVGRRPGHYDLFVGGNETNGRFAELYAEQVPLKEMIRTDAAASGGVGPRGWSGGKLQRLLSPPVCLARRTDAFGSGK